MGKNKENEYEGKDFSLRLKLFALWLAFRPEKYMLIISHSHVFVEMQDSEGIRNADMVKMYNKYLLVNIVSLMKISDQGRSICPYLQRRIFVLKRYEGILRAE